MSGETSKPHFLIAGFTFILLLDFVLFVCACYSCRQCYTKHLYCVETSGLKDMYRVNDGMGFQLVFVSLALGGHAVHSALLLNKGLNPSSFGYLTGSVLVFVVTVLGLAGFWTTVSVGIIGDLDNDHRNSDLKPAVEVCFLHVFNGWVFSVLPLCCGSCGSCTA
eukprot:TRINITY_DN2989_c0_g1_i5.p1 TRINITY_DN2989_c0_g1~~TRINITY_DN2989_c0_g1_i5.p1  ORF type:complete len:164 (-),score=9.85 TRINITY_DN2989_c0_g1_i5:409-900(-)